MANRHGGPRQSKVWTQMPAVQVAMTGTGTSIGGSVSNTEPFTVLRMIGNFLVSLTPGGTFAEGDGAGITLAIGVVSTDAATLGATAMPDPGAEPEYPWLFWKQVILTVESATPAFGRIDNSVRMDFDIRSMRKMKPRESLIWVLEYGNFSGSPPVTANLGIVRVLTGLH